MNPSMHSICISHTLAPASPAANLFRFGAVARILAISRAACAGVLAVAFTAASAVAAPMISVIPDQQSREDTVIGPIAFTISDPSTPVDQLRLSANVSALFPAGSIVFGGSGANRTATLRPAADLFGTNTVTLTVSNATEGAFRSFLVGVAAVNDPPTLDSIPDAALMPGAGSYDVPLSGITAGAFNESQPLSVTVVSNSNPALFSGPPQVFYSSPSPFGSVRVQPAFGVIGTSTLVVQINDAAASNNITRRELRVVVTNDLADVGLQWFYVSSNPVGLSNALTYFISIRNNGPSNATDVVVTSVLSTNIAFLDASFEPDGVPNSCVHTDGVVRCQYALLRPLRTARLRVSVLATREGTATNHVSVSSAQGDRFPGDNSDAAVVTIFRAADLAVGAPELPLQLLIGSPVTSNIEVTNLGVLTATNARADIRLDNNLELLSVVSSRGDCVVDPFGIACALGDMLAGERAQIAVTVRARRSGVVSISAQAVSATFDLPGFNNYWSGVSTAVRAFVRMTNAAAIQLPAQGTATPYPSSILVSGLTTRIERVTVTLHGLSHPLPGDLEVLLVGPSRRSVLLMSDLFGTEGATNVTLTFDDAASQLPGSGPLESGRYAPTNFDEDGGDPFPAPAPSVRPWSMLDVFRDSDPNGLWSLYIMDDSAAGGTGVVQGGWSLIVAVGDRDLVEETTMRGIATADEFGGSGQSDFQNVGRPVLNAAGKVAFEADFEITIDEGWTETGTAVWTANRRQDLQKVAGDSDRAPGLSGFWTFEFDQDFDSGMVPALNGAGVVSFGARVFDSFDGFDRFSLWSGATSNELAHLALVGDDPPGLGEEWYFEELSRPFLSDSGAAAFRGRAYDDFFGGSTSGYWLGSARSNLTLLAREGQRAPGADGNFSEIPETGSMPPILDASGRLAFLARADNNFDSVAGLWVGTSEQDLKLVALGGMSLPGQSPDVRFGTDLYSWRLMGFDDAGRIYFRAEAEDNLNATTFTGIWAGTSPDDLELIARTYAPVFVGTNRYEFEFISWPVVARNGTVIFTADILDENGFSITTLWRGRHAGELELVAYDGQSLDDGFVLRLDSFESPVVGANSFGRFVFRGSIEDSQAIPAAALLAYDPDAGLVRIARMGEIVEVAPGDFRRLYGFSFASADEEGRPDVSGGRGVFNDAGELAFRASFEDSTSAILIAQVGGASVEGNVWYDRTANAVRDTEEPGVAQTRVDLFSAGPNGQVGGGDDVLVASRLTDEEGHYRIGVSLAGVYFLQFGPPLGFGFVARDQGGDDTRDSDADPASGRTAVFNLGPMTQDATRSAGLLSGFAAGDTTAVEGNDGPRDLVFRVSLGVPRRFPVSVSYTTQAGTAQPGVDFLSASGELTFQPGEASKTVTVTIVGDSRTENDETVLLTLHTPVGAPLVRSQGTGKILNDDPVPPVPSQPYPANHSVLLPLNLNLFWTSRQVKDLFSPNGGFESGNLEGWTVAPVQFPDLGFEIESGTVAEGQFSVFSSGDFTERRVLSRRVTLPFQFPPPLVRWQHFLGGLDALSGSGQFRVEVRNFLGQTLDVLYESQFGDTEYEWVSQGAYIYPWPGSDVEIAFVVESDFESLMVGLDSIRLEVDDRAGTTFDVYFGTNPVPGPAEFQGTTMDTFWTPPPLSSATTYYWQIVARREEATVAGPIWRFSTRRNVTNDFAHLYFASDEIVVPNFGEDGRAWPYPSTITVRNLPGAVAKATVTLHGLSHSYPEDLDILLVAPNGQGVMLLSDAGGSPPVAGLTLTFDEAAAGTVPQAGPLQSGVFRPADYEGWPDDFPLPAPRGPHSTSLASLGEIDPNGNWRLFVFDGFSFEDGGAIAEGWSLSLTLMDADTDSDGLPDDYESVEGLNPLDASDGAEDMDGDGHTRGQEYLAGTDPFDPENVLRIRDVLLQGDDIVLEISVGFGRDFRVERRTRLDGPATVIAELPGRGNTIILRDFGARSLPGAFYRVQAVPAAAPVNPESESFLRVRAVPVANTSFSRFWAISEEVFMLQSDPDGLFIQGTAESPAGPGSPPTTETFTIGLIGVTGPGQFPVTPGGPATANYVRSAAQGLQFDYAATESGDGGFVQIDILDIGFVAGRFTLVMSDGLDPAVKIQVAGSFQAFLP